MLEPILVILFSVAGALAASLLACVPGLHIYNVMALVVLGLHGFGRFGALSAPEILIPFFAGLMVGYVMLNTIPSILLASPDESALFTVMPGQKYLMRGRGYEGIMITTLGGLAGLFMLVLVAGPCAPGILPRMHRVFAPHAHWILWCIIAFMLMSEWPKGGTRGQAGWHRFLDGWKSTGAGLITFLLAGFMGFVLLYRSPLAPGKAFQNLMPAFVGLFTLPWLIMNIASGLEIPPQGLQCGELLPNLRRPRMLSSTLKGVVAGTLGGGFAAFFPAITGGVGGFLAGHATAMNDDRSFLVSQGASKLVYYVGGFLFLFVPGLHVTRGGGASLLSGLYVPSTRYDYFMVLAAVAIGGSAAFMMIGPLSRFVLYLIGRFGYRRISIVALVLIVATVAGVTGTPGLVVMLTGTGIGLIPVLFGSRRMNCLGIILLPMAFIMSGRGPEVASALGLLQRWNLQ